MLLIHHRRNRASELIGISSTDGVEIDLRSSGSQLILQHDPFADGENFDEWLDVWRGQFLVLNIKEEGLENRILESLSKKKITEYFFLDQSFPFLQRTVRMGNRKVAARASDIESVETALAIDCEWVWIDCFNGDWSFLEEMIPKLAQANKKICLVSPELVRANSQKELDTLKKVLKSVPFEIDAVCSKDDGLWR